MTSNPPNSVLVYVGFDRIGDGFLKLPFVRGLRAAFPGAWITWLAGREDSVYAGVLADLAHGLINEIIENAGIGISFGELFQEPVEGSFRRTAFRSHYRYPADFLDQPVVEAYAS